MVNGAIIFTRMDLPPTKPASREKQRQGDDVLKVLRGKQTGDATQEFHQHSANITIRNKLQKKNYSGWLTICHSSSLCIWRHLSGL
jgi:hypothetical protein